MNALEPGNLGKWFAWEKAIELHRWSFEITSYLLIPRPHLTGQGAPVPTPSCDSVLVDS
jgi:hypothetical protein